MIGKNVTVDTICLSMERISAWMSASGLLDWALSQSMSMFVNQMLLSIQSNLLFHSLGGLLNKIDIKDPPFERHSRVLGYNCYNELGHRPR